MSAQIKISQVGVPSEKNTGIKLDVVSSADPAPMPQVKKTDAFGEHRAMSSNNMPAGRKP